MSAPREQFEAKWLESHQLLEIYPEFKYVSWLEEQYDALQAERDEARQETKHWYEATLTSKRWREEVEAERDALRAREKAIRRFAIVGHDDGSLCRLCNAWWAIDSERQLHNGRCPLAEPAAPQETKTHCHCPRPSTECWRHEHVANPNDPKCAEPAAPQPTCLTCDGEGELRGNESFPDVSLPCPDCAAPQPEEAQ